MNRLIFGCGYLGYKVAQQWLEQGDTVFPVTRSTATAEKWTAQGFTPIVADVTQPETLSQLGDLPEFDTLLFAVGMDRSRYKNIRDVYVDGLKNVLNALSDTRSVVGSEATAPSKPVSKKTQLIYISSTGVYGDFAGQWIDETAATDPKREGGKACLAAEQMILGSPWCEQATILRFAGIYGPGRVPTADKLRQKLWDQLSPTGYLNLIHVADGAGIVCRLANELPAGQIYHVSDGQPPLRRDYYDFLAEILDVGKIPWDPAATAPAESRAANSKRVSNKKLVEQFDLSFRHPDFRSGVAEAIAEH